MNVTAKKLVWEKVGKPHCHVRAVTPFGRIAICRQDFGTGWRVLFADKRCGGAVLPSVEMAVAAAEKWFEDRVRECLEDET